MDSLVNALTAYAVDSENAELNFNLALEYLKEGQTAATVSFLLRAAERTDNKNLAYECMLKIGLCLEAQRGRGNSVRGAFSHALCLLPKRPEAYYLLARHYQTNNDHVFGYSFAELGLELADFNQVPLRTFVGYYDKWSLLFQKMVSSWHWGKAKECRNLLQVLKHEYRDKLDQPHWQAVQNNLLIVGGGSAGEVFHHYSASQYDRLRYKFPGSEYINRNWSQVFQDMFVLSILDGKKNGTYLEIGAGDPEWGNNTKLLELLGWTGVGIEWNGNVCENYRKARKNPVLQENALAVDYNTLCDSIAIDGMIDYLQLDCEPSSSTYAIMTRLPFDRIKFGVITYEHDDFVDLSGNYKLLSRQFLKSKGYVLMVSDMSGSGVNSFEDWWVHPNVLKEPIKYIMKDTRAHVKHPVDYMLVQED